LFAHHACPRNDEFRLFFGRRRPRLLHPLPDLIVFFHLLRSNSDGLCTIIAQDDSSRAKLAILATSMVSLSTVDYLSSLSVRAAIAIATNSSSSKCSRR